MPISYRVKASTTPLQSLQEFQGSSLFNPSRLHLRPENGTAEEDLESYNERSQ